MKKRDLGLDIAQFRQVCDEIEQQQVGILRTHALCKAQASDRFGKMQKNLILQAIAEWLLTEANKPEEIEQWLEALLEQQKQVSLQSGYTISNLLSLLMYYKQKHWCFEPRPHNFSI